MYIGLYDSDLQRGLKTLNPSLELMKLAKFYGKNDFVEHISNFSNYEKYDKIYFRKEGRGQAGVDYDIVSQDRVVLLGKGFFNSYIPLTEEQEKSELDRTFYQTYFLQNKNNFSTRKKVVWNKICFDPEWSPLRLSYSGGKLGDFEKLKQKHDTNLMLYDDHFFERTDLANQILDMASENRNKIFIISPSSTSDFELFKKAKSLEARPYDRNQGLVSFSGPMSRKEFVENYQIFNNAYGIKMDEKPSRTPHELIVDLMKYMDFIYYIYAKGGQTTFKPAGDEDCIEQKLVNLFAKYSGEVGKTSNYNFSQYINKNSKTVSKEMDNVFAKYPFFKPYCEVYIKDIVKRGVWKI